MTPRLRATQNLWLVHLRNLNLYWAWSSGMMFLFTVNMVSKKLQSKFVCIDVTLKQIEGAISYFEKYRNEGFANSLDIARSIAIDMGV